MVSSLAAQASYWVNRAAMRGMLLAASGAGSTTQSTTAASGADTSGGVDAKSIVDTIQAGGTDIGDIGTKAGNVGASMYTLLLKIGIIGAVIVTIIQIILIIFAGSMIKSNAKMKIVEIIICVIFLGMVGSIVVAAFGLGTQ